MTDEELKAARALCDAATNGPWRANSYNEVTAVDPYDVEGAEVTITGAQDLDDNDNAAFIAASRTLVPALLDEVARREVCWSCPDCAFTYAAHHVLADGSHACPVCEAERLRKDADDQTVVAYRLMKQRDEAIAEVERLRAVYEAACVAVDRGREIDPNVPWLAGDLVTAIDAARKAGMK